LAGIPTVNSFDVEIAYKDVTYSFIVERIASDISRMSVGGNVADAQVACAADGALFATFVWR
jgi:acetyl-CoA carboxylase / biotin carboxylase 1